MQKFKKGVRSSWSIFGEHIPKDQRARLNISDFMDANVTESATLKVHWEGDLIEKRKTENCSLVTLPEYYKLVKTAENKNGIWTAIPKEEVPQETGLNEVSFKRQYDKPSHTYVTPEAKESTWKTPGPVAGPYRVKVGDGSTVTYYWYRFADQPALLNADLNKAEREEMQRRVELLHKHWTKDREYLPPPMIGKLAEIDPALIVTPPPGMEFGYVPIVTRQGFER